MLHVLFSNPGNKVEEHQVQKKSVPPSWKPKFGFG